MHEGQPAYRVKWKVKEKKNALESSIINPLLLYADALSLLSVLHVVASSHFSSIGWGGSTTAAKKNVANFFLLFSLFSHS